ASREVVTLAEGVTRTMFATKLKIATGLLLALGLLSAVGYLPSAVGQKDPGGLAPARQQAPESRKPQEDGPVFRGRVLDPDGKPFAGARIYVLYYTPKVLPPPPVRGTSGKDGRFEIKLSPADFDRAYATEPWKDAWVVAAAD